MKKVKIELTNKEIYLLWVISCWFIKPNWHITGSLVGKLYDAVGKDRDKFDKKYRDTEIKRFADVGKWLIENHPELINKSMKGTK